jgi:hypothetical protein
VRVFLSMKKQHAKDCYKAGSKTSSGESGRKFIHFFSQIATFLISPLPIHEIRAYFGEYVAMYFSWLGKFPQLILL